MTQLDPHFRAAQTSLHVLKGCASMLHSSLAAYLTVSRSFVCRYLLNGDNFYVVVEGGSRLLFNPANKTTLPCTFGLAAVEDALVVQVDNAVRCWNTLNSCLWGAIWSASQLINASFWCRFFHVAMWSWLMTIQHLFGLFLSRKVYYCMLHVWPAHVIKPHTVPFRTHLAPQISEMFSKLPHLPAPPQCIFFPTRINPAGLYMPCSAPVSFTNNLNEREHHTRAKECKHPVVSLLSVLLLPRISRFASSSSSHYHCCCCCCLCVLMVLLGCRQPWWPCLTHLLICCYIGLL